MVTAAVFVVVVVAVVVAGGDVGLVSFEGRIWKSDPTVCNSSIGVSCPQQPPS